MKLKATVAVLGTATFLQLLIGTTTFADPRVDMPRQVTDKSLAAAINKLKGQAQPSQESPPKASEPTKTALPVPAAENSQPTVSDDAEKTPDAAPVPDLKPEVEDVITLDLTTKKKAKTALETQKRSVALKKRTAPKDQSAQIDEDQKLSAKKPSKQEALDRRRVTLARAALGFRGTPYVWGGDSPRAFDCSGFTQYLYRKYYSIRLPHNAKMQFGLGKSISRSKLVMGDLVFFNTRGPLSHVGMYIGDGKFIHAANPRKGVRVDSLAGYYTKVYAGARRYR